MDVKKIRTTDIFRRLESVESALEKLDKTLCNVQISINSITTRDVLDISDENDIKAIVDYIKTYYEQKADELTKKIKESLGIE